MCINKLFNFDKIYPIQDHRKKYEIEYVIRQSTVSRTVGYRNLQEKRILIKDAF